MEPGFELRLAEKAELDWFRHGLTGETGASGLLSSRLLMMHLVKPYVDCPLTLQMRTVSRALSGLMRLVMSFSGEWANSTVC
jgi:hypothetical protein